MNDLERVGPHKPLGYLPLDTVKDPDGTRRALESRGMSVIVLNQVKSNVASGAMVAYDPKALGRLLKSRRSLLAKSKWPEDPDEFARFHMNHPVPFRTDLFDLIADAYGDYDSPMRKDSKSPMKVASRYMSFGLLKSFHSPLF